MPAFTAKEVISVGTTIKILFYGDIRDTNIAAVPQPAPGSLLRGSSTEFGLRILKDTLEAQSSFLIRFSVDMLLRHHKLKSDGFAEATATPGLNKLTPALLKKYDQVWFFGQQYANLRQWFDDYGGPDSELDDNEVAALRVWMDAGGGVLITGDHSNDVSYVEQHLVDASLRGQTLNLGRAIGHRVPRAGQMRVWVGAPDAGPPSYYVDTAADPNMGQMPKQEDAIPQTIRVGQVWRKITFTGANPLGLSGYWWQEDHPLFRGRSTADYPSTRIDILPDHVHEGAVDIPRSFDPSVWPRRGNYQPQPEVVAWGTNKAPLRFAGGGGRLRDRLILWREVGAVAAYDGDAVGVGRIVAHSTWHHFVNVNLVGFRNPDGTPGKVLRRLGEYFANLTLWLSPWAARWRMWSTLVAWTARHPMMREMHGAPALVAGDAAIGLMRSAIGEGALADLAELPFAALQPDDPPSPDSAQLDQPSLPANLLVGQSVLDMQRRLVRDPFAQEAGAEHLVASAHAVAQSHAETLSQAAATLRGWSQQCEAPGGRKPRRPGHDKDQGKGRGKDKKTRKA